MNEKQTDCLNEWINEWNFVLTNHEIAMAFSWCAYFLPFQSTNVQTISFHFRHPVKKLYYSLTAGNLNNVFAVNPETGEIKVSGNLDYETRQHYTLTLTASDGAFTNTTTVQITVKDVNDNPPGPLGALLPLLTKGGCVMPVTVKEAKSANANKYVSILDQWHTGIAFHCSISFS